LSRLDPSPDAPVFAEPWQAEAFAMVVALHERGLFSWNQWAEALSTQVKAPGGENYYAAWLVALENLLVSLNVTATTEVDALTEAWQRAAHATPHGQPILLENDPARST
jgi:nitrile hydratase accessory protein